MNITQYLLITLAEECAEVAQRASKALRFTLDEIQPGHEFSNAERIMHEFADLVGVYEILQARGALPAVDRDRVEAKKDKVAKYIGYSQERGVLQQRETAIRRLS